MFEKRFSQIHGYGLIATQDIPPGTVLIDWISTSQIIGKDQYKPNTLTSIRLAGDMFLEGYESDNDYINHSDTPNTICILGLVIVTQPIAMGEEITTDYRFLNAQNELDVVVGIAPETAIRQQAQTLTQILKSFRGIS